MKEIGHVFLTFVVELWSVMEETSVELTELIDKCISILPAAYCAFKIVNGKTILKKKYFSR